MRTALPLSPGSMLLSIVLLGAALSAGAQDRADDADDRVLIYRCTDADGRLTLRDTPCVQGQDQRTRSMLRPTDAPPRAPEPAPAPAPEPQPKPQVVMLVEPQPMYECIDPDGERYLSDTGDGNPRWVPLWTLGYPGGPPRRRAERGPTVSPSNGLSAPPVSRISIPSEYDRPRAPDVDIRRRPPRDGVYGYGAGTWIRDECRRLPQGEVCERLRDRRSEIRRRFFNAGESERDTLRVEERGINARLANDCGIR